MGTLDDRIEDLSVRVSCLENKIGETREEALKSNLEQYKMITEAVKEGNKPIIKKIEKLEARVNDLEDKDGKRSSLILKTIMITVITTTIGWVVSGFLNNYATITSDRIAESENGVIINENA